MLTFLTDIQRARRILEKKKLVLYHLDADGTTAAALIMKFFPGDCFPVETPRLDRDLVRDILDKKPEAVVFLDLAVDQDAAAVKKLEEKAEILILDHHLFEQNLNSKKTLYMNPRLFKKDAYLSASYIVFHLLKALGKDVDKYAWISAVGIIGDYAFREGKDVLDIVKKQDPSLLKKSPLNSRIGDGAKLVSSAITVHGNSGGRKVLDALVKAEDFDDFSNDPDLQKAKEDVDKEIDRVVLSFEKTREFYPDKKLAILEVESKYPISSAVSTILSTKNPDFVVIIKRKYEDGVKMSLRNQSGRVNLNDLVKKASEGIGRGGGHEKAAGAFVTDWDKFKKRFLELL